jgi:hypothetical protein
MPADRRRHFPRTFYNRNGQTFNVVSGRMDLSACGTTMARKAGSETASAYQILLPSSNDRYLISSDDSA